MNGRIYDPLLGRFLSADLLVTNPGNLQTYNRYSYVNNNPLSLTDPSGFAPVGAANADDEEKRRLQAAEEKKRSDAYSKHAERVIYGGNGNADRIVGSFDSGSASNNAVSSAAEKAQPAANNTLQLNASDIKSGPGDTVATTISPATEAKDGGLKKSPMPAALAKRLNKDETGRRVMARISQSDVMVFSGNTNELGRAPGIERTQGRSLPPQAMQLLGLSAKYGMVIDEDQIQELAKATGLDLIDVMRDVVVNETIPIFLQDDAAYQAMTSQQKQIHELKQDKGANPTLRRSAESTAREPGSSYNPRVIKGREIGPSGLPVNPLPSELQLPSNAVQWEIPK